MEVILADVKFSMRSFSKRYEVSTALYSMVLLNQTIGMVWLGWLGIPDEIQYVLDRTN